MEKRSPYSRGEILTIALAGLIVALLCALGMSWYLNRDNRWVRIVSPPNEPVTQIIAVDRALRAYVKTPQGNLYLCGGNTWLDACSTVTLSDLPTAKVPVQWTGCTTPFPEAPPAPGVVVDSIEVGRCLEASTFSKLIVLNDGSLWQWRMTYSWASSFGFTTSVILGLGAGLIGGLVLVRTRRYLRTPVS